VHGGIDVPVVLGSRSTYPIGAIGGVEGRALVAGDLVPVGAAIDNGLAVLQAIQPEDRPVYSKNVNVRVMLGLYDHKLSATGLENLLGREWVLTPVADRMGLRYSGPGAEWTEREQPFGAGQDPSNIVDAGYAVGSIQIPGGTQPIILHRDAVSGGGYAMAATVISADMDLVARCAPGTKTRFVAVTMEEALEARRENTARAARIWS
jgi:allophanate hydrolase subunit 2